MLFFTGIKFDKSKKTYLSSFFSKPIRSQVEKVHNSQTQNKTDSRKKEEKKF